jgi:ADP-ribosyl-[dinitrogen reductase] hydrolase
VTPTPPVGLDERDRFRGCLLAGAVGDALGGPVEFWSIGEIRSRLGPAGVTGFVDDRAEVTDDTQMTLFTAEGLIRSSVRSWSYGISHIPTGVHRAYLRWLHTQGESAPDVDPAVPPNGWLVNERRLHRRRAPGTTCLSALRSGSAGTTSEPINDSKGCGGVMRVAPVGLWLREPETAFRVGCDVAALTHGHPSGWLSAGALAAIVSMVTGGGDLDGAVVEARRLVGAHAAGGETVDALDAAVALAAHGRPAPEDLERLGGAWVGEEALAIALACALAPAEPLDALLSSVNHSGDSDSTGAICGNLLGALLGEGFLPPTWVDALDIGDVVCRVADDLWRQRTDPPVDEHGESSPDWWAAYPGL